MCGGPVEPHDTERRELWAGTVGGLRVSIAAELRGAHIPASWSDRGSVEEHDAFELIERLTVEREGGPARRTDTTPIPHELAPSGRDAEPLREAMRGLSVTTCPLTRGRAHGLAYRIGSNGWNVLWEVGARAIRAPLGEVGATCDDVVRALPDRDAFLAEHPGSATACLALHEVGRRDLLASCYLRAAPRDGWRPPDLPEHGLAPGGPVTPTSDPTVDHDELVGHIAAEPSAVAAIEAALFASESPRREWMRPLVRAGRVDAVIERAAAQCADPARPCSRDLESALLGSLAERELDATRCMGVSRLAAAFLARGEPERAMGAVVGSFRCDGPELRPALMEGLGHATAPEGTTSVRTAEDMRFVDAACRPTGTSIHGGCASLPRFAGAWLARHCAPEAVTRAAEVAASRPREPFDPGLDQRLDGALRVLGACDANAFESAIAHLPEREHPTTRTKALLRVLYRPPPWL